MNWASFHRARRFARPSLGTTIAIYASSLVAAATIVLLIVALGAITDLVTTRGNLSISIAPKSAQARTDLQQLAGSPDRTSADQIHYVGRGLLPAVWRLHGTWLGGSADRLYEDWTSLRHNDNCLLALVVSGWILSLVLAAALYVLERTARVAARKAVRRVRRALYQQSVQLGPGDLLLGHKHNVVQLFVERVEVLARGLLLWSRAVPQAVLLFAALLATALYVDVALTAAAILLAITSWWLLEGLRSRSNRKARIWADAAAQRCDSLVEDLLQVRSLGNLIGASTMPGGTFEERLKNCYVASVRQFSSPSVNEPAVLLFALLGGWLILLLLGLNVLSEPPRVLFSGTVVLGAAVVTMIYPLRLLQKLFAALPVADQAAADVMGYLDRQPAVGQLPDAKPLVPPMNEISLANVRLASAQGAKLLDDVSLSIRCGTQTAVVASDAETPLALAGLLPRFYDPAAGRILFDGQDIGRGTIASLRSEVSVIVPGRILVTGSITENIAGGDPQISAREVIEGARQALAYDFIHKLPHGFETVVGEHVMHLSAVEAWLLGIARILVHNPAIAIIGEIADRQDAATEDVLSSAMARVAQGRTLIVLARRLPTLRSVERVLLFHEGKIHGDGNHAELLESSELYRHLNYVRFNEFRDKVTGPW
ncbi:MAG TPA: ATP-binding cassette domain-containing protein [Pirellulales bacterium]|nr:ATP-binding cassette domain-containing protein [Pirellulales bacterium]